MEQAIFHIKTPDEWRVIRQEQPATEDELAALDDIEFRARFRERCHHTMEIQVYEAIEKKTTLPADQTETAELYFRVWDRKGLSHDLPDYRSAEVLLRLARALQAGEVPDLAEFSRPAYTEEEKAVIDRILYERRSVRHWDWERPVPAEVIRKVLEAEKCPYEVEVNLLITDAEGIRTYNREYREIDRETDVLSFPGVDYEIPSDFSLVREDESAYLNPDTEELVLGDIVICAARVFSQAEEYGHTPLREFAFLVTHSMLHLLGYDHMEPEEEKAMFARQEEILKELGITR